MSIDMLTYRCQATSRNSWTDTNTHPQQNHNMLIPFLLQTRHPRSNLKSNLGSTIQKTKKCILRGHVMRRCEEMNGDTCPDGNVDMPKPHRTRSGHSLCNSH